MPGDCDQIQKCIDQAQPGATIIIDKGQYSTNLVISKDLTLQGRGADLTIIMPSDRAKPTLEVASDQPIRVLLTGIGFQGAPSSCASDAATCPSVALLQGTAQVTLRQVEVTAGAGNGLSLLQQAEASIEQSLIRKNSSWGITVGDRAALTGRQLLITGNGGGLTAEGLARVMLGDSQITQNAGMGALTRDTAQLNLEENRIEDNTACGVFALTQGQVSGVGNVMDANGADLCGGAPASLRFPLTAQTVRSEIAFPGDYATLQEAVDAIIPGGTITLAPGKYPAGLTLWKPLTLKGADSSRVILEGRNGESPAISTVSEGQGVQLEGVTLSGGLWGALVGGQGEIALDHVAIRGNGDGLAARDGAQITIRNSQIHDNFFNGLSLKDASRLSLHDSTIEQNDRWGITLVEPPCVDGTEPFSGSISGAANRVQSNGQKLSPAERNTGDQVGNFCPKALEFLGSLSGGSY
jgi:nitrous oxidase accessory protein NosD